MIKTVLKIDGMMCGMCESHVNYAIRQSFKVKKVNSSHKKGETEIISEEELPEEELKKAVEATGYQMLSYSSEPYEKKKFSLFGR